MNTQIPIFTNKKSIIFFLGLAVILTIIMLMFLPKKPTQSAIEETVLVKPSNEHSIDNTEEKIISPTEFPSILLWNTYHGENYSFQHPKNWTIQKFSISGGGESVLVKPDVLPDGVFYPQFILQTQPAGADVISRKEGILAGFGLVKESVVIDNSQAIKYKGTIPFKSVGVETLKEPIQDTTYLLEKNGMVYVLKFEYEGASANSGLDEFFDGFITSFKTK